MSRCGPPSELIKILALNLQKVDHPWIIPYLLKMLLYPLLLVYADDNMLEENLQIIRENAEIFIKTSKDIGLEVNSDKTKYMITSRQHNILQNQNIVMENLSFENVEKFKYLGIIVTIQRIFAKKLSAE